MTKTLFIDLDGTLIQTKSGTTFPKDCNDWKFRRYALESLIQLYEMDYRRIFIVTNQGGIPDHYSALAFRNKLNLIIEEIEAFFQLYYSHSKDVPQIHSFVAVGMIHPGRKPNPYFFHKASNIVGILDPKDCLMIGDMAGGEEFIDQKTGEVFRPLDTDKMFAKNSRMKFMHIDDLLEQTKKIYESKANK